MSIQYKFKYSDLDLHYNSSRQYQKGDLVELYSKTFCHELQSRYAVSKLLTDSSGVIAQNHTTTSNVLTTASSVVSMIPVIGGIIGGVLSVAGGFCGLYSEHKAITKAKHFMTFVQDEAKFKDFIDGLTRGVVHKHAQYLETLPCHKESIKWVNKKLSEKLDGMFDKDHTKDEKLVITLAHAHAKIVIKAIEKGLDSHYQVENENKLKHTISETFWDDNYISNSQLKSDFHSQENVEVTGLDDCLYVYA
jgi:hypothetical protein